MKALGGPPSITRPRMISAQFEPESPSPIPNENYSHHPNPNQMDNNNNNSVTTIEVHFLSDTNNRSSNNNSNHYGQQQLPNLVDGSYPAPSFNTILEAIDSFPPHSLVPINSQTINSPRSSGSNLNPVPPRLRPQSAGPGNYDDPISYS